MATRASPFLSTANSRLLLVLYFNWAVIFGKRTCSLSQLSLSELLQRGTHGSAFRSTKSSVSVLIWRGKGIDHISWPVRSA